MITVFGKPGDEPGDRLLFDALRHLPAGWLAYSQPRIVSGRDERNPDYVLLHRDHGYVVLEVKDYVEVKDPDAKGAMITRQRTDKAEWEQSPVTQARKAAELMENKLKQNPDLRNYQGKLDFPYRFAGVLPNLPVPTISWLSNSWGYGKVLGAADLDRAALESRLLTIPAPFSAQMTEAQFNAVRKILDAANAVRDIRTGQIKGTYSLQQEELAKAPFQPPGEKPAGPAAPKQEQLWGELAVDPSQRLQYLEEHAPEEVLHLKKARNVKLVRGYSGTGKTDVLVMRARYLYDLFPDLQMLVTSFNSPLVEERLTPEFGKFRDRISVCTFDALCKSIFQASVGSWPNLQDVGGVVKYLAGVQDRVGELVEKYGTSFVEQEITWMKDAGLTTRSAYLSTQRTGRAKQSGRLLSAAGKKEIFEIFTAYQARLQDDLRAYDWPDMHQKVWEVLQKGTQPGQQFDLIFIDEAQHFAPLWLKIVAEHLKPEGSLFMCEDPSQSVYRFYSWEQKGIPVSGRTRWLRVPYRTTREIFRAAYSLCQSNPLAKSLLGEDVDLPDLDDPNVRSGDRPQAHNFSSYEKERQFVKQEIERLAKTVLPAEIAILHTEKHVRDTYSKLVPVGVTIDEIRRRTGMEYRVVFIPQAHRLFSDGEIGFDVERRRAEHQLAVYTAMTRARERVYLLYGQKWPGELEPLRPHVAWLDE